MKTETKTIGRVASEILDNMIFSKRDDGTNYYHLKNDCEWMTNIIRDAHQDHMPSDRIYEIIVYFLESITDCETYESAQDRLCNIESDIYTSDLTAWLHDNNSNLYYLTEAIEEGATEGFQALSIAQYKYKYEIADIVLSSIESYITD